MATRVPQIEPDLVRAGDGLLARLGAEVLRLEGQADAIGHLIEKRQAEILHGMASRNLTRIDLVDSRGMAVHIRRVGRTGVVVA